MQIKWAANKFKIFEIRDIGYLNCLRNIELGSALAQISVVKALSSNFDLPPPLPQKQKYHFSRFFRLYRGVLVVGTSGSFYNIFWFLHNNGTELSIYY